MAISNNKCGFASIVTSLLLVSLSAQGHQDQRKTQQPPSRFGVEVNYVEVDAIVTDEKGRFVADLRPEDFELYEEGKLQDIASFSRIHLDTTAPEPSPLEQAAADEPGIVTNRNVSRGRVYVLVLDDLHTAPQRTPRVKEAAREFIEKHFGPNDMAAVVHTSGRSDAAQEFTSNRRLLLAAVDKFLGRKLRSASLEILDQIQALPPLDEAHESEEDYKVRDPLEQERSHRARETLEMLEGLSEALESVTGRRKSIVYFGEGIDYDIYNFIEGKDATFIIDDTRRAIGAAHRANVAIYAVDPRGLTQAVESAQIGGVPMDIGAYTGKASFAMSLQDELRLSQDSLEVLSEETGGFALLRRNDFARGLDQIVEENSHYYLLGYYPAERAKEGKYRHIEVRVKRPGLRVKARKGYVVRRPKKEEKRAERIDAPEGSSAQLSRILQSAVPVPDVPLRVTAALFHLEKDKALVPLTIEVGIDRFQFKEQEGRLRDKVEISAIAVDSRGKVKDSTRRDLTLTLRPQTYEFMKQAGLRVLTILELPRGRYQIRVVVAEDGAGLGGSIFYDLEVPEVGKMPLLMTPLVVTSEVERHVPLITAEEDRGRVLLPPATRRVFSRSDRLFVLSEIYPKAPISMEITTRLESEDQRTVFQSKEKHRTDELGGSRSSIVCQSEIPLSELEPGDYLLEVRARNLTGDGEVLRRCIVKIV